VDCVSGGRLDVGLGAGWYAPEYTALGMEMPRPGERLDRLVDALEVVKGLLGGGPFTYEGVHHSAHSATNRPHAVQRPRPRGLVVDTLVLGAGAVPFQVSARDDVELLLDTCTNT